MASPIDIHCIAAHNTSHILEMVPLPFNYLISYTFIYRKKCELWTDNTYTFEDRLSNKIYYQIKLKEEEEEDRNVWTPKYKVPLQNSDSHFLLHSLACKKNIAQKKVSHNNEIINNIIVKMKEKKVKLEMLMKN